MKYILSLLLGCLLFSCNTKYGYEDTGLANGNHECSMYEYLLKDSYNWDSTRLMIERAELVDLFEGQREGYDTITFFGPTNHSIRRWMIQNRYARVSDIPVDVCHDQILRHVVKGKYLRDEIERGVQGIGSNPGEGGQYLTGGIGNEFWIYSFREPYNNVPNTGPVYLYILSLTARVRIDVASTNIETYTGIVHSLSDYYLFGTL